MQLTEWDYRWLGLAKHWSRFSKDPSTQVGAVVAKDKNDLAYGYNGFPTSCEDKEEWLNDRETKYKLVVHAELNAVIKALEKGHDLNGAGVYTYPLCPCSSCATLLAAAGIKRVVSMVDLSASKTPKYLDTKDAEFIFKANNMEFHMIMDHDELHS